MIKKEIIEQVLFSLHDSIYFKLDKDGNSFSYSFIYEKGYVDFEYMMEHTPFTYIIEDSIEYYDEEKDCITNFEFVVGTYYNKLKFRYDYNTKNVEFIEKI